jgi:hypothetical protein
MTQLAIIVMTAVAIVGLLIARAFRRPKPLNDRIREWAAHRNLVVLRVDRRPDHLPDIGLPGAGYDEVKLLVRDSAGSTRDVVIRFSAAVIGSDRETVVSISPHKNA